MVNALKLYSVCVQRNHYYIQQKINSFEDNNNINLLKKPKQKNTTKKIGKIIQICGCKYEKICKLIAGILPLHW